VPAELGQLKDQLREAQKLAALGTVAAMIAHEYNNVFTPIISYAQFALDKDDVPLMRKTLQLALRQFDAVQKMTDRILGLASRETDDPGPVQLSAVVDDAIGCLGRDLARDGIQCTIEVDPQLHVRGHHNQLQQVLFNLVLNARQAMLARGGTLKIAATPISDHHVTVHVRDTGCGVKAADLERIFDPFFSTKRSENQRDRRGIGLGLAICREIVQQHGGQMTVESVEGRGTTFSINLPLAQEKQC
jgi:signal transduction histidine kinase